MIELPIGPIVNPAYVPDAENEILREHIVKEIYEYFSETSLIVMKGGAGSGKTIQAKQFYEKYREQSAFYFAGPNSNQSNLNNFHLHLCEQFAYVIGKDEIYIERLKLLASDALIIEFESLYRDLAKYSVRYNKIFYIIVDGFENLYKAKLINDINNTVLLTAIGNIKILLTSSTDEELDFSFSLYKLGYFSSYEIKELYNNTELNVEQINEIASISPGIPAIDVTAKRLLKHGLSFEIVKSSITNNLQDIIEIEWEQLDMSIDACNIMVLVAVGGGNLDHSDILSILNIDSAKLFNFIRLISFIHTKENKPFISSGIYIDLLKNKLESLYNESVIRLNNYYASKIQERNGLIRYANHLTKYQNKDVLQSVLSITNIKEMLSTTGDLKFLGVVAESIARSQYDSGIWRDSFNFSLVSSISNGVSHYALNQSEFYAYVNNKKYSMAFKLIERVSLRFEKLRYYCIVYAEMQKSGEKISKETIQGLLDFENLIMEYEDIKSALEIGATAYVFSRELAEILFKKALGNDAGTRYIEAARSQLALQVKTEAYKILGRVPEQENIEDFVKSQALLGKEFHFKSLMLEVASNSDTSASLLLIINWCENNRESEMLVDAYKTALDLILVDKKYQPSIKTLRKLSELFKWTNNFLYLDIQSLVSIAESVEKYPLEEYYRLFMNIEIYRIKTIDDFEKWIDIYVAIDDVTDIDTKCFLISHMILEYKSNVVNDDIDFIEDAIKALRLSFLALLESTAEHSDISEEIINNTLLFDVDLAIEFAESLNTFERRDSVFVNIIEYISKNISNINDVGKIDRIINSILNPKAKEFAVSKSISNALSNNGSKNLSFIAQLYKYKNDFIYTENKIYCDVHILIKYVNDGKSDKIDKYKVALDRLIDQIDSAWGRTDVLFWLSSTLYGIENSISDHYLAKAIDSSAESIFTNQAFASFYRRFMYTVLKSFKGISEDKASSAAIPQIERQISVIPSKIMQSQLLAEFSIILRTNGRKSDADRICNIILDIAASTDNLGLKSQIVTGCAYSIYLKSNDDFISAIVDLDIVSIDRTISNVLNYLLTDKSPLEVNNIDDVKVKSSNINYLGIINLIGLLNFDYNIAYYVTKLIDAMISFNKSKSSKEGLEQSVIRRDATYILHTIERIKNTKLPDNYNIKHEGYKIELDIHVMRLKGAMNSNANKPEDFRSIINTIDTTIKNIADRAFLYIVVGEQCREQDQILAKQVFDQASQIIQEIPSALDRASRSHYLAKILTRSDSLDAAKKMIEFSLKYLRQTPVHMRNDHIVKQIMQLAHNIDSDYASTLPPLIENPTRRHFEDLEIKVMAARKDASVIQKLSKSSHIDRRYIVQKIGVDLYKNQLSGKQTSKNDVDAGKYILECISSDISSSIMVYAWFVNNSLLVKKDNRYFANLFSDLSAMLDLTANIANSQNQYHRIVVPSGDNVHLSSNENVVFFPTGSHLEALNFIKKWLTTSNLDQVTIYDPYFNFEMLELLEEIDVNQSITIQIYTLWKAEDGIQSGDIEKIIERYQLKLNEIFPNGLKCINIRLQLLGVKNGDGPMHDRFIHTNIGGLDLSSSLNGLGRSDTKITRLNIDESTYIFQKYVPEITINMKNDYKGERLILRTTQF